METISLRGRFQKGHRINEGRIHTPEHREATRQAALRRSTKVYRKLSVSGVVYPNLTQAAKATGISARALGMYARSDNNIFKHIFFIEPEN
jgi:hypothetical protein